ncbi:RDD family protein [Pseudomonas sp. PWP3-1b2]|uniref:RDD family protein n=1 Tax=Pseudomonas sp. PWP3-1b2 TaxID=2804656 RepID=UPI003CF66356
MDTNPPATRPTILASVSRRLMARVIDSAITVLIFFVVKFSADGLSAFFPAVTAMGGFLCAFLAGFAYLLLADVLPNGQSLGKRLLSIATVDRKTRTGCSVSQSFTRNAGVLVVIDWVWIFMESRTRLGDMFAKTIVIQTGNLTEVRSLADIYDDGTSSAARSDKGRVDDRINDLLHFVPTHADYAVDATDLDRVDIPDSRIAGVTELLRSHPDDDIRLLAARLLTSWGMPEGLSYTVYIVDHFQAFEGFNSHRLHGHDETFKFVLRSLVSYFCKLADQGEGEKARAELYEPIVKIIQLSNERPFEIVDMFSLVSRNQFKEFIPALREHLLAIAANPELHRWKIYDVLELLLTVDAEFASGFLKSAGKSHNDFNLNKTLKD